MITMILFTLAALLVTIAFIITIYFEWSYMYWKRKNIPYLPPKFPFGNVQSLFTNTDPAGIQVKDIYDRLKAQGHRHGGFYLLMNPAYMPIDLEIIKAILTKDFEYFVDRGNYMNQKDDPLSAHLLNLEGQQWRDMRSMLTPTFTPGKIRSMVETMMRCSDDMIATMDQLVEEPGCVNIKSITSCFTTDVISKCAFGLECNSFKNPNGYFRKFGEKNVTFDSTWQLIKITISLISVNLASLLKINIINKECTNSFLDLMQRTIEYRKSQESPRKDLLNILMNIEKPTLEQISAQAFLYFLAGFEAASCITSFCLYELSMNSSIQAKLRGEVNEILKKHDGKFTYDSIMEMKYLDQVVHEALRKYPIAPVLRRVCLKDYKIPHSEVTIEKGTTVFIPVYALHRDPEYYPDPDKFEPERFNDENKREKNQFAYMPFGKGPRTCIAFPFGLIQTKIAVAVLLNKFSFSLNRKTKVPLNMNPFRLVLTSTQPIILDFKKLG